MFSTEHFFAAELYTLFTVLNCEKCKNRHAHMYTHTTLKVGHVGAEQSEETRHTHPFFHPQVTNTTCVI